MRNFNTYQINLEKSLKDKLFFVKHINLKDYDLIVDFGCGTGIVINELKRLTNKLGTNPTLIGYDQNDEMINFCNDKYDGIHFTNNLNEIKQSLLHYKNKLIIFSSVLHEMKEYDQIEVIGYIMPLFDTIVIRDMKRPLNNVPIPNRTRRRVLNQVAKWQADMFEKRWGKIRDKYNLYRFFLMNEFVDNFVTEVEEDYFGVSWSQIDWTMDDEGYKMLYGSSYTLPYRAKQVKMRFNHVMNDITHREVIYIKEKDNE